MKSPFGTFATVVLHLDDEDDDAAREGDEVGDEHEDTFASEHPTLNNEGKATYGHHNETGQRDAIGITRTNGLNGLRQIAENQADAGNPAANVKE